MYGFTYITSGIEDNYYFIKNLQGDVIGLLNSVGVLIAQYRYDAWGKLLSVTNASGAVITSSTNIALINPIRYRGYYYDSETGFYYLKSRYYDPETCRFLNADGAIGANQDIISQNLFAYCSNNPVNRYDPNGTDWYGLRTGTNYGDYLTSTIRYKMEVYEGGIKNCIYINNPAVNSNDFFGVQFIANSSTPIATNKIDCFLFDINRTTLHSVTVVDGDKKLINRYVNVTSRKEGIKINIFDSSLDIGLDQSLLVSRSASTTFKGTTYTLSHNGTFGISAFSLSVKQGNMMNTYRINPNYNNIIAANVAISAAGCLVAAGLGLISVPAAVAVAVAVV